jgi:hypothetical protein
MNKFMILTLMAALSLPAFAEDKPKDDKAKGDHGAMMDPAKKKEMRKKMADAHRKLADCLETDKPMKDCHEEMRKSMKDMHHEGGEHEKDHEHHDAD